MKTEIILALVIAQACGHSHDVEFGFKNYTEYRPGTLEVILVSCHGGYMKPDNIPDRMAGCFDHTTQRCEYGVSGCTHNNTRCPSISEADTNSQELTRLIAEKLKEQTGKRPHVVISHLHRTKLDCNREVMQAAQGNPDAVQAWNDFHGFVKQAKASISSPGLFFDIHGQSHAEKWLEIGYVVSPYDLDNNHINITTSSIRSLASRFKEIPANELIRGNKSFGGLMEAKGYKTVPSPAHPGPNGTPYFWAGAPGGEYNTKTYGSRDEGNMDGLQLESTYEVRHNISSEISQKYAQDMALTINEFLDLYYRQLTSTNKEPTSRTSTASMPTLAILFCAVYMYFLK